MSQPITAERFVRDILASEEYREALKGRLLAGTAKVAELELAAKLGLATETDAAADEQGREAMRRMPRYMRRILMRLLRISNGSVPVPACREITGPGGTVGLVFATAAETGASAVPQIQQDTPTELEPDARASDLTDDLMPKRTP